MPSPRHDVRLLPTFRGLSVVFLALSLVVPPLLPPLLTVLCLYVFVTYGDLRMHLIFTNACRNLPNIFIITVANYEMNGSLHVFPSTPGRVKTEPVKANKNPTQKVTTFLNLHSSHGGSPFSLCLQPAHFPHLVGDILFLLASNMRIAL